MYLIVCDNNIDSDLCTLRPLRMAAFRDDAAVWFTGWWRKSTDPVSGVPHLFISCLQHAVCALFWSLILSGVAFLYLFRGLTEGRRREPPSGVSSPPAGDFSHRKLKAPALALYYLRWRANQQFLLAVTAARSFPPALPTIFADIMSPLKLRLIDAVWYYLYSTFYADEKFVSVIQRSS